MGYVSLTKQMEMWANEMEVLSFEYENDFNMLSVVFVFRVFIHEFGKQKKLRSLSNWVP